MYLNWLAVYQVPFVIKLASNVSGAICNLNWLAMYQVPFVSKLASSVSGAVCNLIGW